MPLSPRQNIQFPARPPEESPWRQRLVTALITVAVFLAVMWGEELADTLLLGGRLDLYGILPRSETGLRGIVLEPFLHASFAHLISNTVPFAVLAFVTLLRGVGRFWAATVIIVLAGGLGVWLFAPANTLHIGASGLVFGYIGYLVAAGWFARDVTGLIIGLSVLIVYGGVLWGALPGLPGVSWQSHLFGLLAGVLAARLLDRRVGRRVRA